MVTGHRSLVTGNWSPTTHHQALATDHYFGRRSGRERANRARSCRSLLLRASQALHEFQRRHDDMSCAVFERTLQLQHHLRVSRSLAIAGPVR